eukprot:tig00020961_g16625.t1
MALCALVRRFLLLLPFIAAVVASGGAESPERSPVRSGVISLQDASDAGAAFVALVAMAPKSTSGASFALHRDGERVAILPAALIHAEDTFFPSETAPQALFIAAIRLKQNGSASLAYTFAAEPGSGAAVIAEPVPIELELFEPPPFPTSGDPGHPDFETPFIRWLSVVSDFFIFAAYFSIPFLLLLFASRRKDLPFHFIFLEFGLFIVSCGTSHLVQVWMPWYPTPVMLACVKLFTAIVSCATAATLLFIFPEALRVPTPTQLAKEVEERKSAEAALQGELFRSALLRRITTEIRSTLDASTIFVAAATSIGVAFEADRVTIHSFDPARPAAAPCVAEYLAEDAASFLEADLPVLESPFLQRALGSDIAVQVESAGASPLTCGRMRLLCGQYGIRSLLAVRTSHQGEANGLILLHGCFGKRIWREDETTVLEQIAESMGVAVFQSRLLAMEKMQREELERANAAAESAGRAKTEFFSMMSHEIRTPMNAVIGLTTLLLMTELTAEQARAPPAAIARGAGLTAGGRGQREYAETIRASGDALLTILNDILDFQKLESDKLQFEFQPFDLASCVEEALDLVSPAAAAKGLGLSFVIEDGTPGELISDITRLRQVLVNLLSNAVKFTKKGEIAVLVGPAPPTGGPPDRDASRGHGRDVGISPPLSAGAFRAQGPPAPAYSSPSGDDGAPRSTALFPTVAPPGISIRRTSRGSGGSRRSSVASFASGGSQHGPPRMSPLLTMATPPRVTSPPPPPLPSLPAPRASSADSHGSHEAALGGTRAARAHRAAAAPDVEQRLMTSSASNSTAASVSPPPQKGSPKGKEKEASAPISASAPSPPSAAVEAGAGPTRLPRPCAPAALPPTGAAPPPAPRPAPPGVEAAGSPDSVAGWASARGVARRTLCAASARCKYHTLLFRVVDTGIGVPPDRMGRLFKTFSQVDSSISRQYGGTGLGLAIVNKIVGYMAGRIWAESVFGHGATFSFTAVFLGGPGSEPATSAPAAAPRSVPLPLPAPAALHGAAGRGTGLEGRRVLVVHASNRIDAVIVDGPLPPPPPAGEASGGGRATPVLAPRPRFHSGPPAADSPASAAAIAAARADEGPRLRGLAGAAGAPLVILLFQGQPLHASLRRLVSAAVYKPVKRAQLQETLAAAIARAARPGATPPEHSPRHERPSGTSPPLRTASPARPPLTPPAGFSRSSSLAQQAGSLRPRAPRRRRGPLMPAAAGDVTRAGDRAAGAPGPSPPRAAPQPAPAAEGRRGAPEPRFSLRILQAEDNAVNAKLCKRLLQHLGRDCDVAGNGLEALDAVRRVPYDVVRLPPQRAPPPRPHTASAHRSRSPCQL